MMHSRTQVKPYHCRSFVWALVCLVLLLAGCRDRPSPEPEKREPPGAGPSEPSVELGEDPQTGEWRQRASFDVGVPAAKHYQTDETAARTNLADDVEGINPELQWTPCLNRAAQAYAAFHPHEPSVTPPRAFVEFLLHWSGCPDSAAAVRLYYTTEDNDAGLREYLGRVLAEVGSFTNVGIGRAPGDGDPYRWTWAVLLTERKFSLDAFPREAAPGEVVPIEFTLSADLAEPRVLVMAAGGAGGDIVEAEVLTRPNGYIAPIEFAQRTGTQWVEILAEGPLGPVVVALFPVHVGMPAPAAWEGFLEPDERWIAKPEDAEMLMLKLVNRDRADFGLPALEWDPELARVARGHSTDMRDHKYFAHVSPAHGTLSDRLRDGGYEARYSAENIARNPRVYDAEAGLMESLGHRANILTTEATRMGVGVAVAETPNGDRTFFITQNFARPLERPEPQALRRHILDALNDERIGLGLNAIAPSERLDGLADEAARVAAASGFDGQKLNSRIGDALERQGSQYRRFRVQYQQVLETSDFAVPEGAVHPDVAAVGVGIAVVPATESSPASLATLVLLLER